LFPLAVRVPSRLVGAIHEAGFDASNVDRHDLHDVVRRFWEHFTGGDLAYTPPPYALPSTELQRWRKQTAAIDDTYATLFQDACSSGDAIPLADHAVSADRGIGGGCGDGNTAGVPVVWRRAPPGRPFL
jgi:hypothetical protein